MSSRTVTGTQRNPVLESKTKEEKESEKIPEPIENDLFNQWQPMDGYFLQFKDEKTKFQSS